MSSGEGNSGGTCGSLVQGLVLFKNGLTMTGGDCGSLTQLFFDNLSTLLGALFAMQGLMSFGVSQSVMDNIIFGKIVPGVGITLAAGNLFYSWQAIRLTAKWGRQYTAQPYGLNTPAAFAFVFNIIYTVFFVNLGDLGPDQAFTLGYKVALSANFVTGLFSIVLGAIGPLILKVVPPAALLVPIAGIGISFLGLEQLSNSIAAPIVGYMAIMWAFLGWYSGVRVGYGGYYIPEALMVILSGVALGWATGLNQPENVEQAATLVKWWGPVWTAGDMFSDFKELSDYLGIVIPIGISATATTMMCLVSAKEAGDPYPIRETMIVDGIGTCVASFFGSPFGTVIYIGHPAHKRNGAKVGYSLANGCIYLILSWFGVLAVMQSIVNSATIGPIVFFVGLLMNEETLNFMPSRHYSAYIIGIFPSIYDWAVNICGRSPLQGDSLYNMNYPAGSNGFIGVLAWKRGSLLVSLIWTAMVVMILDRKFYGAAIWGFVGALFALFGIIHVPQAGFKSFTSPTWDQCTLAENGAPDCWDHAEQWMFFVAYLAVSAVFVLLQLARHLSTTIPEELDDPTSHAFDDWFKDAAVESHPEFLKKAALDGEVDPTAHIKYAAEEGSSDDPEEGHKVIDDDESDEAAK